MSIVKTFLVLVLTLVVFFLCGSILIAYRHGSHLLSVQTGSMVPTFSRGDAVITRSVKLNDLKAGDIVSYRNPNDKRVIVSHRLISINYETGRVITKGDALELQDIPIPASQIIGRVTTVVPYAGYALDWLHQPTGLAVIIYLPATVILVSEARRLGRQFAKPRYSYMDVHSVRYR